jgi:hypothetical protein
MNLVVEEDQAMEFDLNADLDENQEIPHNEPQVQAQISIQLSDGA